MSAIDEFGGAAVSSVWDSLWPFNRARLEISADTIACTSPSGRRRAVRYVSDGSSVTITRYRYVPFCWRTIVWIDRESRTGFIAYRWWAVRDSLTTHKWQVEVRAKSWLTVVSDSRTSWRGHIDTGEFPAR